MKLKTRTSHHYQKALEYYSKGNCKKLLNDYKGAIADFTKAIKYNANFAEAYYKRANTKLILNDIIGAKLDYDKAILLNPEFGEALINRGITRRYEGDLQGSNEDFYKAGKLGFMNAFAVRKELFR